MAGLKGDFIGFSFNGKHSSDMGITRVSDGNRYNDNVLPTMQDKTATVPGADGTYFFKTNYTQKPFNINFAFDSLTESEYRGLRQWLGDKKPHDLIFDEIPYKVYKAKVTGNATIKTICFDNKNITDNQVSLIGLKNYEKSGVNFEPTLSNIKVTIPTEPERAEAINYRIGAYFLKAGVEYKFSGCPVNTDKSYTLLLCNSSRTKYIYNFGNIDYFTVETSEIYEMYIQIQMTASSNELLFVPMLSLAEPRVYKGEGTIQFTAYNPYARSQYKTVEEYESYSNVDEWIAASGIKPKSEISDIYNSESKRFKLYNPGDIETDFKLRIPFSINNLIPAGKIYLHNSPSSNQLAWNEITAVSGDTGICIDTKLNLVVGYKEDENNNIIRTNNVYNNYISSGFFFKLPVTDLDYFYVVNTSTGGETVIATTPTIEYDYLYF